MDVKHGTSKIFGCLIYLQFQIPGLLLAIVRQLIICWAVVVFDSSFIPRSMVWRRCR